MLDRRLITVSLLTAADHPADVLCTVLPAHITVYGWMGYQVTASGDRNDDAVFGHCYIVWGTQESGWSWLRFADATSFTKRLAWGARYPDGRREGLIKALSQVVNRPTLVDLLLTLVEEPDEHGIDTDAVAGLLTLLDDAAREDMHVLLGLQGVDLGARAYVTASLQRFA